MGSGWRSISGSPRGRAPWWIRGAVHYGYLLAAAVAIARLRGPKRRLAGVIGTVAGAGLGRALDGGASWFAPVFYVKLLLGHAAGGALTITRQRRS